MQSKKFFKRMYWDEFYIFDSSHISEREFDERAPVEGYSVFVHSLSGDELVDLLNKYASACDDTIMSNEQEIFELNKINQQLRDEMNKLFIRERDTANELRQWKYALKDAIKNERLEMGRSALKQLADNLGVEYD